MGLWSSLYVPLCFCSSCQSSSSRLVTCRRLVADHLPGQAGGRGRVPVPGQRGPGAHAHQVSGQWIHPFSPTDFAHYSRILSLFPARILSFFQIHGTWWCLVTFGEMYLKHWRRIKKVLFRFFLTIRLNLRALRCLKVASLSHLLLTQVQESEGDGENTSGAAEDSTGFYFYMQMRVHKFKILKGIFIQLKTL